MTGVGKSTIINSLVPNAVDVGHTLNPCTSEVKIVDTKVDGVPVCLIDTPGFDDNRDDRTEIGVLQEIAIALETLYKFDRPLSGIVYLQRITDNRSGAVSARSMQLFRSLCGDAALKNVVLCTTMWDKAEIAEKDAAVAREKEWKADFWASMLAHGSTVTRFYNTPESALELIRPLLDLPGVFTRLQTELAEEVALSKTGAGQVVVADATRRLRDCHLEAEALAKELRISGINKGADVLKDRHRAKTKEKDRRDEELKNIDQDRGGALVAAAATFGFIVAGAVVVAAAIKKADPEVIKEVVSHCGEWLARS